STGYFILNAVNSPPSAPALSAPSSGTIVNSSTPTFSWSASSDIDPGDFVLDYTVYYSSNNFITVQSSAGIKKTSFVPTIALVENATYRWNVSARDSEGIFSNISTTWSVIISSVNEIPDPFDLVLPSGTVKTRAPRFVWGPANITEYFETHRYKLNYGFGTSDWTISTETIGSATFYQLSGTGLEVLAENTTYWWEVEAVDSIGQTRKSTQKFYIFISSTNEPPNHFSIISPLESSSINTRTPLLTWQKATDPDEPAGDRILSYTLTYSTSTDFSLPIIHSGITETSWQVPSSEKLLQGATYYWKVTAFDTKGSSATTSVGKFFVLEINKLPPPRYWTRRELLDGGKKFFIEWQQVSRFEDGTTITEPGKEIYGYNVYRSNSPTGTFEKAGATVGYNSYAWTDNSVDGRTYYYLVRTLTPTGLESGDSDMVSSEISPAVVIMSNQKDAHLSISGDLSDKMRINQEKAWLVKDGAECEIRVTKMDSKGVETEQKDYKFGSPVILNFRYTLSLWAGISAQTQQGASPSIFWHNGVEFINLGGIRDTTKGEMSVRINQSGRYKLDTVFEKDFSFSIYPSKIFTPNKDGKWDEIKFNYINRTGEQVSGAVYDLYGGFVSNMASKSDSGDYLSWDGRYQGGEPARKGMYIYQIKYGNRAWTGTIILAR
ncbi:MAG: gliding motility-associated C-terminal domain-containing protein, partial [Elusimicrobia bacterium]|nr:gliding motility-associated C-terminal domain-containing protein [Elusimicrobiota bacterium]